MTSSLLALSTALAPGLVGRVADRPIYKSDFDRWMVIADRADGNPGSDPADLRPQVMQFLVSFQWIDLEAKRLGITISPGAIDAAFRQQKRQSFPRDEDFQEFLAASGQTVEDVKLRVRMDLQSTRISERAVAGAKTPAGQGRRLERFVRRFNNRYRRQTACGTGYYYIRDCVKEVPLSG